MTIANKSVRPGHVERKIEYEVFGRQPERIPISKYRVTQKRELLKNPTKIEEIQEKKLLTEIEPLQLAF